MNFAQIARLTSSLFFWATRFLRACSRMAALRACGSVGGGRVRSSRELRCGINLRTATDIGLVDGRSGRIHTPTPNPLKLLDDKTTQITTAVHARSRWSCPVRTGSGPGAVPLSRDVPQRRTPGEPGCVVTWEVYGGREEYQISLERTAGGELLWHCTCPTRSTAATTTTPHYCKHVRGLIGRSFDVVHPAAPATRGELEVRGPHRACVPDSRLLREPVLQRHHRQFSLLERPARLDRGLRRRQRRDARHAVRHRRGADLPLVGRAAPAARRVDDQRAPRRSSCGRSGSAGPPAIFGTSSTGMPCSAQDRRRAARRDQLVAHLGEAPRRSAPPPPCRGRPPR